MLEPRTLAEWSIPPAAETGGEAGSIATKYLRSTAGLPHHQLFYPCRQVSADVAPSLPTVRPMTCAGRRHEIGPARAEASGSQTDRQSCIISRSHSAGRDRVGQAGFEDTVRAAACSERSSRLRQRL